jgi:hypothetical protein
LLLAPGLENRKNVAAAADQHDHNFLLCEASTHDLLSKDGMPTLIRYSPSLRPDGGRR